MSKRKLRVREGILVDCIILVYDENNGQFKLSWIAPQGP